MKPRFLSLGDSAVTIEFGNRIDQELLGIVTALDTQLQREYQAGNLPGLIETVPTYRSMTAIFDPGLISVKELQATIMRLLNHLQDLPSRPGRLWKLPVCYEAGHGIDLEQIAQSQKLSITDVINLHLSQTYTVYMIGFLPGFPFMGDLVSALQVPRLMEPRTRVPAGSVAIAGQQTAIYPWESPGGWQIIGRCPVPLFDPKNTEPALLAPGDLVTFESVSAQRYSELSLAVGAKKIRIEQFRSRERL
jgi:KipI family sensor histidine kinase inhibitor